VTPADVIKLVADEGVEFIDYRFVDVPGTQHHFSTPVHMLDEDVFEEGLGFDGSSVAGFQTIDQSDMILIPDPDTAFIDPFYGRKTLAMLCDVKDPVTLEWYSRDPRGVAKRSIEYLNATGIADTAYIGPEAEFFIFDGVTYRNDPDESGFQVLSKEGAWATGEKADPSGQLNLGHKVAYKTGYFPLPPRDQLQDLRSEMVVMMESVGIKIEVHHHEVGTAGQAEIDMLFSDLVTMADNVTKYKYVAKETARRHGMTVTFMPKPLFGDNGSGMHTHQSLWKDGETLMYDADGYAGLSDLARYYTGGLLEHAAAILAFAAPTTNSYKRLVPGYEAPVNLVMSSRNRSAAIRIPMYSDSPKAKRLEFRCPDPSANPYLAFSAMVMAGIDGIQNKIEPPPPVDKNIYDLPPEEKAGIASVPSSLGESIAALEADHEFLLAGGVFNEGLIEAYIELKQEEIDALALRPHPIEYELYYTA
jgi:glutamine synthetase